MMETPKHVEDRVVLKKYGKSIVYRDWQLSNGKILDFLCIAAGSVPIIGMPVTTEGNIVLVKQFRFATGEFVCEFPGGNPKPGQTPEDTFRMELDEEVGYEAGDIQLVGEPIAWEPCSVGAKYQIVMATGCRYKHHPHLDETEIMETMEMSVPEFLEGARSRRLNIDSKTATIAFLALPLLGL